MEKYYKILIVPAIIIIIAGFFSGFREQSYGEIAEDLLCQRTDILQTAYYGHTNMAETEKDLDRIETYPLLSEDIGNIRDMDATDLDRVVIMEVVRIKEESRHFPYVSLTVGIRWHMSGLENDYISDNEYIVVLKAEKNEYRLSEFNPK